MFDVVKYTQSLVQFNTINPPGHEEDCIMFAANTLQQAGFHIAKQPFGEKRMNVVASLPGVDESLASLVFTGHLDTVPLGESDWTYSPFNGDIVGDKLYGRGATDMKGGVAAMIGAALQLNINSKGKPKRGITLVLTSGEETGCTGARELINNGITLLGRASAMVVGEPTANKISTAHKGVLFIKAIAKGVTAHSSQPELGDNAIYKVAKAISKIENYEFSGDPHPQLGQSSINVGMISGGMNVNSVPDYAQFTIDIRTNSTRKHQDFVTDLSAFLGDNIELKIFADMEAISTPSHDSFTLIALDSCRQILDKQEELEPLGLNYVTDASALNQHYNCPTLILGPGEPSIMHKTDEYCSVQAILDAEKIYTEIAMRWCM